MNNSAAIFFMIRKGLFKEVFSQMLGRKFSPITRTFF